MIKTKFEVEFRQQENESFGDSTGNIDDITALILFQEEDAEGAGKGERQRGSGED